MFIYEMCTLCIPKRTKSKIIAGHLSDCSTHLLILTFSTHSTNPISKMLTPFSHSLAVLDHPRVVEGYIANDLHV